ncbi:MAG: S-layer homology domain-containing protein [Symbiobacteriaceae bacterium]|nr:S-layer homology domain-containing protein [Symbiobacteriaceae bacterium]
MRSLKGSLVKYLLIAAILAGLACMGGLVWYFTYYLPQPIPRGEAILKVAKFHGQYEGNKDSQFEDAIPSGYVEAIEWARRRSIIAGFDDGKVEAERPFSRQDYFCMIFNYVDAFEVFLPTLRKFEHPFKDEGEIGDWAYQSVVRAYEADILSSKTGTMLDPRGYMTRAEAGEIWNNFTDRAGISLWSRMRGLVRFWLDDYRLEVILLAVLELAMILIFIYSNIARKIGLYAWPLYTLALLSLCSIAGAVVGSLQGMPFNRACMLYAHWGLLAAAVMWLLYLAKSFRGFVDGIPSDLLNTPRGMTNLCYLVMGLGLVEIILTSVSALAILRLPFK